jgi:hypothetical protein
MGASISVREAIEAFFEKGLMFGIDSDDVGICLNALNIPLSIIINDTKGKLSRRITFWKRSS